MVSISLTLVVWVSNAATGFSWGGDRPGACWF